MNLKLKFSDSPTNFSFKEKNPLQCVSSQKHAKYIPETE